MNQPPPPTARTPSTYEKLALRRAALAPTCLLLVAALHLVRVWTCHQTPWKGGGFGMFSTIDDESARFLRCYLVTEQGVLPLAIPPAAEKTVAELRAAPSKTGLDHLAKRLANQAWRSERTHQQRVMNAIHAEHGLAISHATLQSHAPEQDSVRPTSSMGDSLVPISRREAARDAIRFREVRLECWRYRYDNNSHTLRTELLFSSHACPSEETAP